MTHEQELEINLNKKSQMPQLTKILAKFDKHNAGLWRSDLTLADAFVSPTVSADAAIKAFKSYRDKTEKIGGPMKFAKIAEGRDWGRYADTETKESDDGQLRTDKDQLEYAINYVANRYAQTMPNGWSIPYFTQDELNAEGDTGKLENEVMAAVQEILSSSKSKATPGFLFDQIGQTNEEVCAKEMRFVVDLTKARLRMIYQDGRSDWSFCYDDRFMWLEDGKSEPHRVFKKNLPEGLRKEFGRIVMGESIVDQLCHIVIFHDFYEKERAAYPDAPNLRGHGADFPKTEAFMEQIKQISKKHGKWPNSNDASGWEAGFGDELLQAVAEVLRRLHISVNPEHEEQCNQVLYWWALRLMTNLLYFDNGDLCAQCDADGNYTKDSGWRSGNKLTGVVNGIGRQLLAAYVGSKDCKSNGDDALEWFLKLLRIMIWRYGLCNLLQRDVIEGPEYVDGAPPPPISFNSHTQYEQSVSGRAAIFLESWPRMVFAYTQIVVSAGAQSNRAVDTRVADKSFLQFSGLFHGDRRIDSDAFAGVAISLLSEVVDHPDLEFKRTFLMWILEIAEIRQDLTVITLIQRELGYTNKS